MKDSETFYVASKFERKPQVRALMDELRKRGHRILGDWTGHSVEGVTDPAERKAMLRAFAQEDADAVIAARNLVLIHDDHCRGGFSELGIAIGRFIERFENGALYFGGKRPRIIVIGGQERAPENGPIFYALDIVEHFKNEAEFLRDLDRRK